ncbi:MAG: sigma 54-interacting transcriptional regulator [Acidobacteria bacterium]|nr:sigma 54-interacting transcriptional regulator [Acidobacteriota bacterium]
MTELPEQVVATLREDREFVLTRRVEPGASARSTLVLTTVLEHPSLDSLKHLEHEYGLREELDPAWAVRPRALTRHQGQLVLRFDDPGGDVLTRMLEKPLEFTHFLQTAIGLARALQGVHKRGLIHKDVNPANILVNNATGEVRLTGFGIASRQPREHQSPNSPETIAGTLAYMSPEQTGRMNRSLDSRSDLYAFGVTLYELLTGTLPFTASDPMEWIHCHIAKKPPHPSHRRAEIPEPLAQIVMKLLAKAAEDRYQTAAGVEADLRKCLVAWESNGRVDHFPLGEQDASDRLLIPEKLYGREREIETLVAAFHRVKTTGQTELVLVSGYSGVGKTSVVTELHKALVSTRARFACGKFDQFQRGIPYATLAQALRNLVQAILGQGEVELEKWRNRISQAVGFNGQLMINLFPELERIIGPQPPMPELPPQDSQNRFQMVFRRFVSVFAQPDQPLVLFLDDLHWLDLATLDFLQNVVTQDEARYLLVIGAYRDNEVTPIHPLMRTMENVRKIGGRIQDITLAPLGARDVCRLLAETFTCDPERVQPLADLIQEKTGGNPFFVVQFVTALAEEQLISFHLETHEWTWNLAGIQAKGYADNVGELMAGKLSRLPDSTQRVLIYLACLGSSSETALMGSILGMTIQEVEENLAEAIQAGLVFQFDGTFKFIHDRVQEAAYLLIPESVQPVIHLRIGRMLAARIPPENRADISFEIVNHFNRGAAHIVSPEERRQVAELNFLAGKRARSATAYTAALSYFTAGEALLTEDDWERYADLKFGLSLHRAECEFLTGTMTAAEDRLFQLSQRTSNLVDLATVTCLRVSLYTTRDINRAVQVGLDYLRHVGIEWNPHPTAGEVKLEFERMWRQIGTRPVAALLDLPSLSDPTCRATMDVLTDILAPAVFSDRYLPGLVAGRMANLSLEHGNSDASCLAYCWLGAILGAYVGDYQAGLQFGQLGVDLVERRNLVRYQARVFILFGNHILPWSQPLHLSRAMLRRGFDAALEVGDVTFAGYCFSHVVANRLAMGDPLDEVHQEAETGLQFARKTRFGGTVRVFMGLLTVIRSLRGLPPDFRSFTDEIEFEQDLEQDPRLALPAYWYWFRKMQARFFAKDYESAVSAALKAHKLRGTTPTFFENSEFHFFGALVRAAGYDRTTGDEQASHREALGTHHKQLVLWAKNCPETFECRTNLVAAEIARVEGRDLDAMHLYEAAITGARTQGFVQIEGLANELAAAFYSARGLETSAGVHLRNARYCYLRWRADGKVEQLDQAYPHLREDLMVRPAATTIVSPIEQLDLATLFKVSQTVSDEIILEKLIEKLMVISVEHAGAERGILILQRNNELHIEAEATTTDGKVVVNLSKREVTSAALPESILRYVTRTLDSVLLDDATTVHSFSEDSYLSRHRSRSVLCLPLVKHTSLTGVLYLEHNGASHVFTPDRISMLKLLASRAAISLENAYLYCDLQRVKVYLAEAQRLSLTGSFGWKAGTGEIFWSEETYRIFEYDPTLKPGVNLVLERIHPEDVSLVRQTFAQASKNGLDFDLEHRLLMPDGTLKHVHIVVHARLDGTGTREFVGAVMDVTAARQAEADLREREREQRQIVEVIPQLIFVLAPDGSLLYGNKLVLEYTGLTLDDIQSSDFRSRVFHPDDEDRLRGERTQKFLRGIPFEVEQRARRKDGQYRWFLTRFIPLLDQHGHIVRWYATGTDIDDRKKAEEQIRNENIALREEIDKTSMYEEIVGASPALQEVLARISKVAPTDSTVLINGETGTGKELVARAIHKRSARSSRAFVSVNCAAIPPSLIASELFGHEKGAFTGAIQRRLGRFELADGGTIFLDEIGEIPLETQISLLRVLQEREVERVGGSRPIRVDVRIIAATNRDLQAAIGAGSFRSDLLYRLNVFPIEMPSLRHRTEDIPLLVEYFIDRYASKAAKKIRGVNRKTLELFQSYPWPGNIRELQNVIERSIILCETDMFSVDESWLSRASVPVQPASQVLAKTLVTQEKELIEAALAESKGRVSGPTGAAAKLGLPASTLESKIKTLKINKHRFKVE